MVVEVVEGAEETDWLSSEGNDVGWGTWQNKITL